MSLIEILKFVIHVIWHRQNEKLHRNVLFYRTYVYIHFMAMNIWVHFLQIIHLINSKNWVSLHLRTDKTHV